MSKMVTEDGTCSHTGSVCSGSKAGTVSNPNTFVSIENSLVMVSDSRLIVGIHITTDCLTPESHNFAINLLNNNYVFIENKNVLVVGDGYTTDSTLIDSPGSGNFVEVI